MIKANITIFGNKYAKDYVNAFKIRVLADSGIFEAENCIINQILKLT